MSILPKTNYIFLQILKMGLQVSHDLTTWDLSIVFVSHLIVGKGKRSLMPSMPRLLHCPQKDALYAKAELLD